MTAARTPSISAGFGDADITALARLLDSFGVTLGLASSDGRVKVYVEPGSCPALPAPRHGSRVGSVTLADGRRLVLTERDRAPARAPSQAGDTLAGMAAGADQRQPAGTATRTASNPGPLGTASGTASGAASGAAPNTASTDATAAVPTSASAASASATSAPATSAPATSASATAASSSTTNSAASAAIAASKASHPAPAAGWPIGEHRAGADAAEMRFRLLAEHSIDLIVAVDADLAIRYASPATTSLLGCMPVDLLGRTLAELLAPEDRAAFIARHFTNAARRGQGPDLFKALKRDGSTLWVEARVAALPPGNGLGDFLVTLRDADQRKRAELALGQVNAELATLASTDALTGLPNRRQFDATLHKEWFRALREATPLGLLMIDVDRFKPLNDRHGHQVGDAFLARVGRVIHQNVRRAGDMAARYGGEEFAVVLPGTSATGALEIAEVIRRAVACADTHDLVDGGYPLSVSIGAAAVVPLAGGGSAMLVHSADAALYDAKRNGRNRVEVRQ